MEVPSIDEVVKAIDTLYAGNADHQAAHQWLNQLHKQNFAWEIAQQLLVHSSLQVQFFGAQTLVLKTRLEWHLLSAEFQGQLVAQLLALAKSADRHPLVTSRLCLAYATAVVRLGTKSIPIEHLLEDIFVTAETSSPCSEQAQVMIEILDFVPEEFSRTTTFSRAVMDNLKRVLQLSFGQRLMTLLQRILLCSSEEDSSQQNLDSVKIKAIKCLHSWCLHVLGAKEIIEHPICETLFQLLQNEEIFSHAAVVLIDLLSKPIPQNEQGIIVISRVVALQSFFSDACTAENEEVARTLCMIVCALSENNVQTLVQLFDSSSFSSYNSSPTSELVTYLCRFLLQCCGYPNKSIAQLPLPFFQALPGLLRTPNQQQKLGMPLLQQLLPIILNQSSFLSVAKSICGFGEEGASEDEVARETTQILHLEDGGLDEMFELQDYRKIAAECLLSLYTFFQETLQVEFFSQLMDYWATAPNWIRLEVILEAVRYIVGTKMFSTQQPTQSLMQLLVKGLAQPPLHPNVAYTALNVFGDIGKWIKENQALHEHLLPEVIQFVLSQIQTPELADVAAKALKEICRYCAEIVLSRGDFYPQTIVEVMEHCPVVRLTLTEALSFIYLKLAPEQMTATIVSIVQPICARLEEFLSKPLVVIDVTLAELQTDLKQLNCCLAQLDYYEIDKTACKITVAQAFAILWPYLEQVLTKCASIEDVVVSICGVINEAMSTGQESLSQMGDLLPTLFNSLLSTFSQNYFPCMLETFSVAIQCMEMQREE